MNNLSGNNRWSLRRIQIAAVIVITVLFLSRIPIPSFSPQARAERLYLDGWFLGIHHSILGIDSNGDSKKSYTMFKKALELSPQNFLYEQALAWKCPEEDLKNLIANDNLGKEALILASYRYDEYLERNADNEAFSINNKIPSKQGPLPSASVASSKQNSPAYWKGKLDRLDKLAEVDPDNALIRYRRAYIYGSMGSQSDMLDEVRKANSMDLCVIRMPEVSPVISNTIADPRMGYIFQDYAHFRELARELVGYSNEQLRMKDVDAALDTSEEACRMGIRMASMKPANYINYLVASAIYSIGYNKVNSISRDFGMIEVTQKYQNIQTVFNKDNEKIGPDTSDIIIAFIFSQPYTSLMSYTNFIIVSIFSFAVFLLLWGISSLICRIMRRQKVDIKAWDEGWLLKMMLAVYLPLIIIIMLAGLIWNRLFPESFSNYELANGMYFTYILWIVATVNLAFAVILMLKLRKQFAIFSGKNISLLRFNFRIPIEARAWIYRSYSLFFGAQLVFVLCLSMAASQFFISHYKIYPWQMERIQFYNNDTEKITSQKLADEVNRLAVEKGIIKGK